MPTVYLSPTFGVGYQAFTPGGLPLSGGLIYTYDAGTTTPQATYTTSDGTVANSNPIVLGADGRPPAEIWLVTQEVYKFVLKTSSDVLIATYDNISGINDVSTLSDAQFQTTGLTPTYVSPTSFTIVGDQTTNFQAGRRLRFTVTAGTVYGTITSSAFTSLTTVTMTMDSAQLLDAGLSVVDVSILKSAPLALPVTAEISVASATTTEIGRVQSSNLFITGTTTITSFGTAAAGIVRMCRMQGAVLLTHNATSLILPGAANITTAAGDCFEAESLGSGNWVVRIYVRAGTGSTAPLLAGTAAGNLVQLDGSGNLPPVNGSTITNLNASNIATGTLDSARLANSGVTAGSYTNTSITVDVHGLVTAASSGTGGVSTDVGYGNVGSISLAGGGVGTTTASGNTIAGSSLRPACLFFNATLQLSVIGAPTLSGTWRNIGRSLPNESQVATIFQRIA